MSLSDSLRSAWSPETGCPSPEDYLRLESGEVTPEERRRLEEHADRCAACSAERDLARLFAAPPGEIASRQEDVDHIVSHLEKLRLSETPRPLAFPTARRRAIPAWAGSLAALVLLAVALGLYLSRTEAPPPLRDPGLETVVRGGEVRLVGPIGEFPDLPREFRWERVDGARSYRVTLRAVDESVIWQETVEAASASLPADVAAGLHPAVLYTWSVEALDERGTSLAPPGTAQFRVRPPGEGPAPP